MLNPICPEPPKEGAGEVLIVLYVIGLLLGLLVTFLISLDDKKTARTAARSALIWPLAIVWFGLKTAFYEEPEEEEDE